MIERLFACLLFALVIYTPAHGQSVRHTAADADAPVMGKSGAEPSTVAARNVPADAAPQEPADEHTMRSAGFASRIIEALASRNAIDLFRLAPDGLDAYLRPPDLRSDEDDLFRTAREAFQDVTSFRADNYVIAVDPLKMRWTVRINLSGRSD